MINGSDPSGAVVATFNGIGAPVAIKISESLLAQGAEAVSIGEFSSRLYYMMMSMHDDE